jgi:glycosyltransferase involved in cell wall biosynthesis
MITLSVVVMSYGCKNAVKTFMEELTACLRARAIDYEIILACNYPAGTFDPTVAIVQELARNDARIHALAEPTNIGMGSNMKAGFRAAQGTIIGVIDGDGQMPPEDIVRVYDTLIGEHLDIAKTTRVARYDGVWRRLISKIYNLAMRILFFPIAGTDMNAKPKIFTREAYEKLRLESNDWFIDAEIMIQARRHGFRIGEVSTEFYAHKERPSFISLRAIWEFIKNIIRYRWKELFS